MTINGAPKIFDLSKALIKNGDSVAVSSGSASKDNMLDFDKATRWESIGSDDVTVETITITFSEAKTFDRILLSNHNFKSYTITPVTGNFTNVIDLFSQTPVSGISESSYAIANSYYEHDSITTTGIVITATLAQIVDAEKFCFNIIPTEELGTFENFPVLRSNDFQAIANRTINRLSRITKLNPVFSATLTIRNGNSQSDIELLALMDSRNDDFIFWANGGKLTENESATPYYRFSFKPYRLGDFYQCQVIRSNLPGFLLNIYSNPINATMHITESVR